MLEPGDPARTRGGGRVSRAVRAASRDLRASLPVLAICTMLGGTAHAATAATIHPSFLPDRLGANTAFTLTMGFANRQGEVPAPVNRIVLHLPAGLGIDLRGVGSCPKARLERRGASGCASRLQIGRGRAVLAVHAGSQTIPESAILSAFRGPTQDGKPTLEILGQGETPLYQRAVIVGVLRGDHPPYGAKIDLSIPPIPTLTGEPNASISELSLTVGAGGNPRAHVAGAIVVPHSCPISGFPFAADFAFEDGSTASAAAKAPCP